VGVKVKVFLRWFVTNFTTEILMTTDTTEILINFFSV